MDIQNLRYFLAVAKLRSFSQAAAMLHRSQPALSRGIQELESDFGMRLFSREGRNVILTAAGQAMVERVTVLMQEVESTLQYADLLASGKSAILRVGAGANIVARVMPQLIRRFEKDWANVEILIQSGGAIELSDALMRGDIDLAITRYVRNEAFEARGAYPTNLIAVVSVEHRLADADTLTVEQLHRERLLVATSTFSSRSLLDGLFKANHLRPKIVLETAEFNTMIELAKINHGIAVVPSTVAVSGSDTRVIPIFHLGEPVGEWTALVWDRRRSQPPFVSAFIEMAVCRLERGYPGHELDLPRPRLV